MDSNRTLYPFHSKHSEEKHQAADIKDKLIINLRDLNHIMHLLYEGKGSQKRILIILNEVGDITQRELTERLGIQPGSASEVIAKLEASGNIVRLPSEADKRTMDIKLTESGKLLALEVAEQRNKRHEEMFSCLSVDEKNTLLYLLEKLNTDWESRYHETKKRHEKSEHSYGCCKNYGKD